MCHLKLQVRILLVIPCNGVVQIGTQQPSYFYVIISWGFTTNNTGYAPFLDFLCFWYWYNCVLEIMDLFQNVNSLNHFPYFRHNSKQVSKNIFSLKANIQDVENFVWMFCLIFNPGISLVVDKLLCVLVYWLSRVFPCFSFNFFIVFTTTCFYSSQLFASCVTLLVIP